MTVRRAVLVATAALVPLMPAAPAHAVADHIICVGAPAGVTCSETAASIQDAINKANANGANNSPDVIWLAPNAYTVAPLVLNDSGGPLTLRGSGEASTSITVATSANPEAYLYAYHAAVEHLTVEMNPISSNGDTGLAAQSSSVTAVTVRGLGTQSAFGMELSDATVSGVTVQMSHALADNNHAIYSYGSSTVTDSTLTGTLGYVVAWPGPSNPVPTGNLSRVRITADYRGAATDEGNITVDDTLIDLGTGNEAVGLEAANPNDSDIPKSITADHVTIVGGGGSSVGAEAWATNGSVAQTSSITLTNSIISGPATSLDVRADNNVGVPASSATITTSYSDWSTQYVDSGTHESTATLSIGAGRLDVDPGFVNPAAGNYRLASNSALIDQGAPGSGGPTQDLQDGPRVLDGNGDGTAVRDMGAFEAPTKIVVPGAPVPGTTGPDTTAPDTTLTSHPRKRITKRRVTFGLTANEPATFQCRIDKNAWGACTSPKTLRVTRGWHVFRVRARDGAGNLDATPASWRFKRV